MENFLLRILKVIRVCDKREMGDYKLGFLSLYLYVVIRSLGLGL